MVGPYRSSAVTTSLGPSFHIADDIIFFLKIQLPLFVAFCLCTIAEVMMTLLELKRIYW
jgi:hypothetical protein